MVINGFVRLPGGPGFGAITGPARLLSWRRGGRPGSLTRGCVKPVSAPVAWRWRMAGKLLRETVPTRPPLWKPAEMLSPRATYLLKSTWPSAGSAKMKRERRRIVFLRMFLRLQVSEADRHTEQPGLRVVSAEERAFVGEGLGPLALLEVEVHQGDVGLPGAGVTVADREPVAVGVREQRRDRLLGLGGLVVDEAEAPLGGLAHRPAQAGAVVVDVVPIGADGRIRQPVGGVSAREVDQGPVERAPAGPVGVGLEQQVRREREREAEARHVRELDRGLDRQVAVERQARAQHRVELRVAGRDLRQAAVAGVVDLDLAAVGEPPGEALVDPVEKADVP